MRSLKVYFAASIQGGREYLRYQVIIGNVLRELGHRILSEHVYDEEKTRKMAVEKGPVGVYETDMAWVEQADLLVSEVSWPSLGTGLEIGYALYALNKRVVCFCCEDVWDRLSWMIKGNTHPRISLHRYSRDHAEVDIRKTLVLELAQLEEQE